MVDVVEFSPLFLSQVQYAPPMISSAKLTECLVDGNGRTAIDAAAGLWLLLLLLLRLWLTERNRRGAHPVFTTRAAVAITAGGGADYESGEVARCDSWTGREDIAQRGRYRCYSSTGAPNHR